MSNRPPFAAEQPGERPELHATNLVAAAVQLREASRRSIARYSDDS